ncbi:hypothetical protein J1605_008588 [Eschrichtius robustus]|uniref:Uncharacterized protein n=1 Tax=Eschrichtius robustus TaxID=9764 RepID=A0AB34GXF8_ESCRO|nr:hypothetical protein J1605_008588 [Eschrichtius robustus]
MWLPGLVAPRHVGSSQTRARTRVPCIGRQILNHCATREALKEERVVNHMAAKIIENVCTTFSAQAQGFITGETGPVLWYLFKHSTVDSLRITAISALCRITRHSPTAFQNVIEKVGLTSVINSLASAICRVQQYLLTLFSAMLSCGIHLQRLIQEKDFVSTVIRLLDSPSTSIRAKSFLVLLYILIHNREMLLLGCQARMQVLSVCGRWDQHSHPQGIWSGTELGVSVPQSARLQGDDLIRQHLERTGPPPRLLLCYNPA